MLTAIGSDPSEWEGKYIRFSLSEDQPKSGRTNIWEVIAKAGGFLGQIRWFARWRKYSFFPAPDCVFEEVCLGDITDFLKWATHSHKHGV